MTSPDIPRNAYNDAAEQYPNLILGSLQLLFWLFFRPSAWRNHQKRVDPALEPNSFLIFLIRRGGWHNLAFGTIAVFRT
ncbi:MAG: hypothetical protein KME38_09625 [Spirirestis rafaelensis WJT71-NPBG6]|jgi:hypothetical protein|nr:hypothetical protein [Spirirestis rafaelensis WJT71-NPBG6]